MNRQEFAEESVMSDELPTAARVSDPGIRALYRLETRWQAWLDVETALAKRPAAFPAVLATSAHDGSGIPELRAAIARLLAERGR